MIAVEHVSCHEEEVEYGFDTFDNMKRFGLIMIEVEAIYINI